MSSLEPTVGSTCEALSPRTSKRRSIQSTAAWRSDSGPNTVG